jgi:hypothetical protein
MEIEPTVINRPQPEVIKVKEAEAFEGFNITRYYTLAKQSENALSKTKDTEERKRLDDGMRAATFQFYQSAEAIMIDCEGYLIPEDKQEFYAILHKLENMNDKGLYDPVVMRETARFIQRILKNSNINELGEKNEINLLDQSYL